MSFYQRFSEAIQNKGFEEEQWGSDDASKIMQMVYVCLYSPAMKLGDIDFESFTKAELSKALEHIMWYEPDEVADMSDTVHPNAGNAILEVNRAAHLCQLVETCKPQRKRRFF